MADILIRGVEAPTSCENCKDFFLKEYDFPCYRARCSIGGTIPPYPLRFEKRGDDCPILELPPHGDLIDRDALLNRINAYVCGSQDLEFIKNEIIKAMPVVVPAERREG